MFCVTQGDILNSHIGVLIILTKFVKAMNGCDKKADNKLRDRLREQAFSQQLLAYLYLDKNADKAKYGSILTGLNSQQSLGNDQNQRVSPIQTIFSVIIIIKIRTKRVQGRKAKKLTRCSHN